MSDFKAAYDSVERLIESRYGVEVNISDVLDPNTGDLDGLRIKLDYTLDLETAFFVLVHLFGHSVQWNISPEFRALGLDLSVGKTAEQLGQIHDYERDATRYSLWLMHQAGVRDLDRWLSDCFAADWKFLKHFYQTGERLDFKLLRDPGAGELLTPLEIPPFQPQRWVSRWSF